MQMVYENALNIYTDGSCYPGPRRGGIGIIFVTVDETGNDAIEEIGLPGYQQATNNQMELMACIKAMRIASTHKSINSVNKVYVFTDSMYVSDNLNRAKYEWPKQRWNNRDGRPVENADLWKDLVKQIKKVQRGVEFRWVKGHAKNTYNKAVDKLAKQSAKGVLNRPLNVTTVRRKKTSQSVERGSVRMLGQELSVRIVTDTYLRTQKIYKYKYEVLSPDSEYCGKVDIIFSEHILRSGHHYRVKVNDIKNNPRILELLEELDRT